MYTVYRIIDRVNQTDVYLVIAGLLPIITKIGPVLTKLLSE